jgi:hypothetical protein
MTAESAAGFRPRVIFETLNRHQVDYVTIGGFAVAAHGAPRGTFDVDIIAAPEPVNWTRLAAALDELGAPDVVTDQDFRDLDPRDPFDLARSKNLLIRTRFGRVDVLNFLKAAPRYEDLRERRLLVEVGGVTIAVIDLDSLIRLKRNAGREQDLKDIAELTAPDPRSGS